MKKILSILFVMFIGISSIYAAKKVVFVCQPGYNPSRYVWDASGYQPSLDPIYLALAETFDVTIDSCLDTSVEADYDYLRSFDLVVFSEAMSGNTTFSNGLVNLVGTVPILSMKDYNYTSGRWGWATPANPTTKTTSVTIVDGFEGHDIFKGLNIDEGNKVQIFDGSNTGSNLIQGFHTIIEGSPIEAENILATVSDTTFFAIHEITSLEYKYMMIPISSDIVTTVTENGVQLVINACNYLLGGSGGFNPDDSYKVAYLYDSSYSNYCGIDVDPIYNYTAIQEQNCEAIDIKDFTAESIDTLNALAENYDLVVVSEAMSSGHKFAVTLTDIVNRVPMLNFKSFLYKSGVWGWGAGSNPTKAASAGGVSILDVDSAFVDHEIFADVELIDNQVDMFINSDPATILMNLVQGYTCTDAQSLIYNDDVLATVSGINAIHEHGKKNTYMLIPLSSDAMAVDGENNLSDAALTIINNAVAYLIQTKGDVTPCLAPTFSYDYGNDVTTITISCNTSDAAIYYTLDGTEPTIESTLYEAPFEVTQSCTINAIATKVGYDNSSVATSDVIVKSKSATPVITITAGEGTAKVISITATEGATIYYNLSNAVPTTSSLVYSSPITVSRPCAVSAVALEADKLISEATTQYVEIEGYVFRNDTLMWADFNTHPTTWIWANTDTTTTDNGDVIKAYAYTAPTEEDPTLTPTYTEVDFDNGWKVGTYGQRINLQTMNVAAAGSTDNYRPETTADEGATGRCISFLKANASTDPTNAFIQTASTYAGPFDIVTFITGAKSASYTELLEVAVSADNENWTVLDTLSTAGDKLIRRKVAYYDEETPVYVKITSVSNLGTNSNALIYDIILLGEGGIDGIQSINQDSEVVSVSIYNLSGMELRQYNKGVNIVRKNYANGTSKVEKVFVR